MKINHFTISRHGDAQIHWGGTEEEIVFFKNWIKEVIPSKYWGIFPQSPEFSEYNKTHISISLHVHAWTFLCYYWTNSHAPANGQIWKYKQNPYHKGYPEFNGPAPQFNCDKASLQFRIADLNFYKESNSHPNIQKAIDYLRGLEKGIVWTEK